MAWANVAQIIAAGFRRGQLALLGSNLAPQGLTGTLVAGTDIGLTTLVGVQTANINIPEYERVVITGDDRALGAFLFPSADLPMFDIEVGVADFDIAAAFEAVLVRDLEDWALHPIGGKEIDFNTGMLILSIIAQSQASGSDGLYGWYHLLMPSVQIGYLGPGQLANRDGRSFRFRVSVSPASVYPWIEALSLANEGVTEASIIEWTSENPISMTTARGDTVKTDVILDNTPVDDDPTETHHIVYRDGVTEVADSITPATKTVVLSPNLDADEYAVVVYEHTP